MAKKARKCHKNVNKEKKVKQSLVSLKHTVNLLKTLEKLTIYIYFVAKYNKNRRNNIKEEKDA